ncbi:hypothetical protein [Lysinibacillus sp. NPDC093692]|uniref:hypothetical protein n=1 Tax=Lysinibacillus sp. NPDC093692 TaxID=3390578 RepID=UPI003D02FEE5
MQKMITLSLWSNNQMHDKTGLVFGMDPLKKELLLDTDISVKRISFNDIQDAKMEDAEGLT